ncbi:MAG: hypothetical protein AAFO93_15045 [Pseudomonadota bacterium]
MFYRSLAAVAALFVGAAPAIAQNTGQGIYDTYIKGKTSANTHYALTGQGQATPSAGHLSPRYRTQSYVVGMWVAPDGRLWDCDARGNCTLSRG